MVTKRKNDTLQKPGDDLLQGLDEISADEELINVLNELGDDKEYVCYVYRARSGSRNTTFLYDCNANEFSLTYLRDEYGTGDYRVHVKEAATKQMIANKLISIEAGKNFSNPTPIKDNSMEKLMEMMQASQEDQKSTFASMMQSMTSMMLGVLTRQNNQPQNNTKEMIELISVMQGFNRPQNEMKPETMMEMFLKGMTMGKEMSPPVTGAETNDVLIKMLEQVGPILGSAMSSPAQVPQNKNNALTSSQNIGRESQMDLIKRTIIKPRLKELCDAAARDANTELYAELVLDQVPESYLITFLKEQNPVGYLGSIEPNVMQYENWFTRLIDDIKKIMSDAESENYNEGLTSFAGSATGSVIPIPASQLDATTGQVIDANENEGDKNT